MIYLGKNIPEFIMDSRTLIFGIKDDSFIKERILPYNGKNGARLENNREEKQKMVPG